MNKLKILVVEDDEDILNFITVELQFEGYEVNSSTDGMKGLSLIRQLQPDLIILDRMLPNLDGIELCKRIKQTSDIPILMVTALAEVKDRVVGLDAGANDYLVKPFSLEELLARVRVQLRNKRNTEKTRFEFLDLVLDTSTREVIRNGSYINLSPKEFELLSILIQNPRHVLSKEKIIEKVWGWDFEGDDNVIEVCMHGLRHKIEKEGKAKLIHNVRGFGYTLKD